MPASASSPTDDLAIIGGGIAGLTAALRVASEGMRVMVFDKGRGVAGRTSTRFAPESRRFDHGAQYFTAREKAFQQQVDAWLNAGVVVEWDAPIATIECDPVGCQFVDPPSAKQRFVGVPGMNAVAQWLAEQVTANGGRVETGTRVGPPKRSQNRWRLRNEADADLGEFSHVLITAPAPQAAELLTPSPALSNAAKSVRMTACWAAMATFDQPLLLDTGGHGADGDRPIGGCFVNGSSEATPLSWIARDSSKPERPSDREAWVLHASPAWSESHLEIEPAEAATQLLAGLWQATGIGPRTPDHLAAHRWRFALPENALADRFLSDHDLGLYAAGDWCGGPRFEGAYLSGLAAAEAILQR